MQTYNIYRLNDDGTGCWATTRKAESAAEALQEAHETCRPGIVPEGDTYVVVDPGINPNDGYGDGQMVFTLERPGSVEVVPVGLAHGMF